MADSRESFEFELSWQKKVESRALREGSRPQAGRPTDAILCPRESTPKSTFRPIRPPVSGTLTAKRANLFDLPESMLVVNSLVQRLVHHLERIVECHGRS